MTDTTSDVVTEGGSWEFRGRVDVIDYGRMVYTVLYLPAALARELDRPRLRVHAVIDEIDVDGAFQPSGDGRRYLLLSKRVLKQLGKAPGDVVEVRFSIADTDHVEIPDDVRVALQGKAAVAFAALTAGKQRAVLAPVAAARTAPTRQKRIAALARGLVDGTLVTGPPTRRRRSGVARDR